MLKIFSIFLSVLYGLIGPLTASLSGCGQTWGLSLPAMSDGRISDTVYLAGAGLESEAEGATGSENTMELVSFTDQTAYRNYCNELTGLGYENVYSRKTSAISANAFRKDGRLYYTYFTANKGEVRIIEDTATNSLEDFGYTCSEGEGVTIYQFEYPYADDAALTEETGYATNGMLYVILLADNSVIVIDGGSNLQSADQNIEECMRFLRRVTGAGENGTVNIALWCGTHAHSDHVTFFYKLLGFYHNYIHLERVMFNYPSCTVAEHTGRIDSFRNRLAKFYPDAKYLCPHTGMSFPIANTVIDILYTHEDSVSARTGKTNIDNQNDASTVFMVTAAGKRFLVTGDINVLAEGKIMLMYTAGELQCDVLQAAHHLYNSVVRLYGATGADYVFCPNSVGRGSHQIGYSAARMFYKKSQLLFADSTMYSIAMNANGLTLAAEHTDCIPYDNSDNNAVR